MALTLSTRARLLSEKIGIKQQLILEIDGFTTLFGAIEIIKILEYGDAGVTYGGGYRYGGVVAHPDQKTYISLDGSTKNITQQLRQDEGGTGSVSSIKIELIDKNEELTALFQPGNVVADLLSRSAKVYLAFDQGAHPRDSILILDGIIDDYEAGAGFVKVSVAHAEQLKRQELFVKRTTKLSTGISDSDTLIQLDSAAGMFVGTDAVTSYVQIEDEIIEILSLSGDDILNSTRGSLLTTAVAHSAGTEVTTFWRLQGGPIELALKLMLTGPTEFFGENTAIQSFNQITSSEFIQNAIFFQEDNVQERLGLVVGDKLVVTGASGAGNNGTHFATGFGQSAGGSYITVGSTLTTETSSSAVSKFASKYNVMPSEAGCDMNMRLVDVAGQEEIETLFNSGFPTYDIYIKDTITAKTFIEKELYFPAGLYQIPRKGRAGVGMTAPPLASSATKTLSLNNVKNPDKLVIKRSTNSLFYNAIVYKYEQNTLDDEFLAGRITTDADSTNRIKMGNRPLTIESLGLRDNATTNGLIDRQSSRFLDRYKFAAESINVETLYKTGFNIEIGDTVIFEGGTLKIADSSTGNRTFQPRIMEVTNKSMNVATGDIRLTLVDTAFELDGRYGTISPSSIIDSGSTTTKIILQRSYSTSATGIERTKWEDYIGQTILVHSEDWSSQEEVTLVSFDGSNQAAINVTALSAPPSQGDIIDIPYYPDSADTTLNSLYKATHCFFNPKVDVVSGASGTVFDVGAGDIGKFFVGSIIRLHDDDFSDYSPEAEVTDITSNTITVDTDLGFTPSSSHDVELIGHKDQGKPYRYI